MNPVNISCVSDWELCCGCGICAGICPKKSISWIRKNGMFQPVIDSDSCISCGQCAAVCPGLKHEYLEQQDSEAVRGQVIHSFNAWSKAPDVRHVAASGGVVLTMVSALLEQNCYDVAFLLEGYDYREQLTTTPVAKLPLKLIGTSEYPKSRYLPVSHEGAVIYIKQNRDKRAIFIGSSCAVRGFLNAVNKLHLPRENYLVIGLFCDRVFNYNVIEYYRQPCFCGERTLVALHFKNKESGGWPGNMKFVFSNGETIYHDKIERTKIKDYFMPERCLYCIDKLNVDADISLGDNYTEQDSSPLGSNSVIVRTERGQYAWQLVASYLEYREVAIQQIENAQYVDWRLNNLCYGYLKEQEVKKQTGQTINLNSGVITKRNAEDYRQRWKRNLQMLQAGVNYDSDPNELHKQMELSLKVQSRGRVMTFINRAGGFIKRRAEKRKLK